MRRVFRTAPAWVPVAFGAVVTFALSIVVPPLEGEGGSWTSLIVSGCLLALISGVCGWRDLRRQRQRVAEMTGPLTPEERDAVYRAVDTGALPADPRLHAATLRLAHSNLGQAEHNRAALVAVIAVLFGVTVSMALLNASLVFGFLAVVCAVGLVETVVAVPRLRRRVDRLDQAAGPTALVI